MDNFISYKVDWFQCAYIVPDSDVSSVMPYAIGLANSVASALSCNLSPLSGGRLNYSHRIPLGLDEKKNFIPYGSVQWGGNTSNKFGHHCQLTLTGVHADSFYRSDLLLGERAYIQRLDLAYDVDSLPYDSIIRLVDSLPEFSRVKKETYTSCTGGVESTTTYYGSRESAFYIRIYEKGKQTQTNPDWIRVEFEIKPMKTSSDFAVWCYDQYLTNPETILHRCNHANALLKALFSSGASQHIPRDKKPDTDAIRAFKHMIKQYATSVSGVNQQYNLDNILQLFLEVDHVKQASFSTDEKNELIDDLIAEFLDL